MNELTERNQEMWRLRFVEGWKLREIGKWAGISRQRVQQIIGDSGKDFLSIWTQRKIDSGSYVLPKNVEELDDLKGAKRVWQKEWGRHRHRAKGGPAKFGQDYEEAASQILSENGIENKLMNYRCPYDIDCSGIRVDVKVTTHDVSKIKSQNCQYPTFQLPEMKSGKDCDFFFVFIPDNEEVSGFTYFVIPSKEFHHLAHGSRPRIPWRPVSQKPSKWHTYHKRIDLIKKSLP